MNLPDARAGEKILAEHIQRLNAAIKQTQLRPGPGYRVVQGAGGTSIVLPQAMISGGGGTAIPCPFECIDASDTEGMKVQVAWGLIWQMLPTGMMPNNDPPLKLTVTETCYIYSRITFDTDTLLPTEIDFSVETQLKDNTSSVQYNLIARVFVDDTADPKVISSISNICVQPFPSPCSLA